MLALYYDTWGGPEVIKLGNVEKPVRKDEQVLIKVAAASLNPVDYKTRNGDFRGLMPFTWPRICGFDVSGTVEEVPTDSKFCVGDHVFGMVKGLIGTGTIAEFVCVDESALVKKPEMLSHEQAAALPLVAITAVRAFQKANNFENVLILGGSGGVGSVAIQIAKAMGATRVVTTASAHKVSFVKECGADMVIDYTKQKFTKVLDAEFDFILDATGQAAWCPPLLRQHGVLVSIIARPTSEAVSDWIAESGDLDQDAFFPRFIKCVRPIMNVLTGAFFLSRTVRGLTKHGNYYYVIAAGNGRILEKVKAWVEQGVLKPKIDSIYPLVEARKAMNHLETGCAKGKVVITMTQDGSTN